MQEFYALLELLGMLLTDPRTCVLFILLMIAAVNDCRTYKIPNWLTASGTVFALIYGSAVAVSPQAGLLLAIEGLLAGFFVMLPLYAFGAMGAGDVKLMAMIGAFLGFPHIVFAVIATFVAGGIVALGFALFNKALGRVLINVKDIVLTMVFSASGGSKPDVSIEASKSIGKMPYGVSIGIGTIGYVIAHQLGYW